MYMFHQFTNTCIIFALVCMANLNSTTWAASIVLSHTCIREQKPVPLLYGSTCTCVWTSLTLVWKPLWASSIPPWASLCLNRAIVLRASSKSTPACLVWMKWWSLHTHTCIQQWENSHVHVYRCIVHVRKCTHVQIVYYMYIYICMYMYTHVF